jgi:hypothetical protein
VGEVIRFPGIKADDAGRPGGPEEVAPDSSEGAEAVAALNESGIDLQEVVPGLSPELLMVPLEDIAAARQAIDDMLSHFRGARLELSGETQRQRAAIVAGYKLRKVFDMMGRSTREDWMQHPAMYGALAQRCLAELQPLEALNDDDPEGRSALDGLRPDDKPHDTPSIN